MTTPTFLRTGIRQVARDVRAVAKLPATQTRQHRTSWKHRVRNRMLLIGAVLSVNCALAPVALADSSSPGEVWFSWMTDKDTHGHQITDYSLRVSQGGLTDPITKVGAFLLQQFWDIYRLMIAVVVWCLDQVLTFKMLEIIRIPAAVVANALQDTVGQLGIVPLAATCSILISGVWLIKGRSGAGLGEMAMSVVIAALVGTAIANPVAAITGPNGAIVKAEQLGSGLTIDLLQKGTPAEGSTPTGDPTKAVQSAASARVLDVFVRTPQQLLNFGATFDGPSTSAACQKAYDASVAGGSIEPMKTVCPKAVKTTIESPQNSLVGAPVVLVAAVFLGIFALALLMVTTFLMALATYEAVRFVLSLVKGIFPGASRAAIFEGLATMAVAVALLSASILFLGVYLVMLVGVFDQTKGWPIVPIYITVDLVSLTAIIALLIMAFKARKHGKKFGRNAANALAPKPVSLSNNKGFSAAAMGSARVASRQLSRGGAHGVGQSLTAGAAGGAVAARTMQAGTTQGARRGFGAAAVKGLGMAAKGAVAYTVGAPVAIPRATKAAQVGLAARKAAVRTTLQAATSRASEVSQSKTGVAKSYMQEYKHNVAAAGRFIGQGTTAAGSMATGQPPKRVNPSTVASKAPADRSRTQAVNQLRQNLGQAPMPSKTPPAVRQPGLGLDPKQAAIAGATMRAQARVDRVMPPPRPRPATRLNTTAPAASARRNALMQQLADAKIPAPGTVRR